MTADSVPIRLDDRVFVVSRARWVELDGETVVYDPEREEVHLLDSVATSVWSLLGEEESLSVVCDELAAAFGAPLDQVRSDVLMLVSKLHDSGLIELR